MIKTGKIVRLLIGAILILTSFYRFRQDHIGQAFLFLIIGIVVLLYKRKSQEEIIITQLIWDETDMKILEFCNQNKRLAAVKTCKDIRGWDFVTSAKYVDSLLIESKKKVNIKDVVKTTFESKGKETSMTIDLDESKLYKYAQQTQEKKEQQIINFTYNTREIQSSILQILETIYIMDNSKSVDTVKGRNHFLRERYNIIKLASFKPQYKTDSQFAIDNYKSMYHDRIPSENQIRGILKPNDFDFDEYYSVSIYKAFTRFYSEQKSQINALKKDASKKARREKLMDLIDDIRNELTRHSSDSYLDIISKLEKTYDDLYQATYN
jgi:hypothetical protein